MAGYPNHFIPNAQKNKKWVLDFINAAYSESQQLFPNGFYNSRDKYNLIRLYMQGKQPINKYRKMMDPANSANQDKSWLNIDWSILPIVPRYRRMAVQMMGKQEYDLQADIVNSMAEDDKDKYYRAASTNIMIKDALTKNGMEDKVSLLNMQATDPQTKEELDIHMKYGYKHEYAVKMEEALELVMNTHNKFHYMRTLIRRDLIDYNVGCVKDDVDSNGYITLRKPNIKELIVGPTEKEDFSDCPFIGEVRYIPIRDIAKTNEFTVDELRELAENNCNKYKNPPRFSGAEYLDFRVKVLDMEFFTTNTLTLEKRMNKAGNYVVARAGDKKKASRTYSSYNYDMVYKGKWIIGTDKGYECGPATDVKRPKEDFCKAKLSYKLIVPDLEDMSSVSLGEQMITIADQIQIAWYKMQNAILRAIPSGVAIDIASLLNVPLKGSGGEKLSPMKLLDLLLQRGMLVYRGYDDQGKPMPQKPFEKLQGGIGDEADRWFGVIQRHIQLLKDIIGFNDITDGSTPDPRTLKSVADQMTIGTNNSIGYLYDAEKQLVENLANDLTIRIQDVIANKELSGYIKPLGAETQRFFKIDKMANRYTYGMSIKERPSAKQEERLARRIEAAIASGQLTHADATFVENFQNINMREQVMAYRVKKNLEKMQEDKMAIAMQNAQAQQQSAVVAETEKRKTLQLEHQFKMQQIQLEKEYDVRIEGMKGESRANEAREISTRDLSKKQMDIDSAEYIQDKKLLEIAENS